MKIIAMCQLTNFGGIGIIDFIYGIDDFVKFVYVDSEKIGKIGKAKIRYTADGQAYFKSFGKRYYLNEFIRL